MNYDIYFNDKEKLEQSIKYYISKNQLIKQNLDLAQAHIDKAKHNLGFFDKNKNDSKYNDWLVVILYYSLYHCALALVSNKNYVSKNHTATLLFLIKNYSFSKEDINFIEKLSINKNDAEFYNTLKDDRHNASYSTSHYFDDEKIKEYRFKVNEFLQKTMVIIS